uniref:Uncharacterized protein n=1 Tax=Knipowitschia caucasica TaxID=637954 RepID=A0AAV2K4S0_KNICA
MQSEASVVAARDEQPLQQVTASNNQRAVPDNRDKEEEEHTKNPSRGSNIKSKSEPDPDSSKPEPPGDVRPTGNLPAACRLRPSSIHHPPRPDLRFTPHHGQSEGSVHGGSELPTILCFRHD